MFLFAFIENIKKIDDIFLLLKYESTDDCSKVPSVLLSEITTVGRILDFLNLPHKQARFVFVDLDSKELFIYTLDGKQERFLDVKFIQKLLLLIYKKKEELDRKQPFFFSTNKEPAENIINFRGLENSPIASNMSFNNSSNKGQFYLFYLCKLSGKFYKILRPIGMYFGFYACPLFGFIMVKHIQTILNRYNNLLSLKYYGILLEGSDGGSITRFFPLYDDKFLIELQSLINV